MQNSKETFANTFITISQEIKEKGITISEVIERFGERSHAFVILLASLPFLIPLTIPGFSTPFGLLIIIMAACMMLQVKPWLPAKLSNFELKGEKAAEVFMRGSKIIAKIEGFAKPRLAGLFHGKLSVTILGFILVIAGVLLALPTPPGGNFPPAVALVLLSIGILERDFLFTALGIIATVVTGVLFYSIIALLIKGALSLT